jgi:hypothetical protein
MEATPLINEADSADVARRERRFIIRRTACVSVLHVVMGSVFLAFAVAGHEVPACNESSAVFAMSPVDWLAVIAIAYLANVAALVSLGSLARLNGSDEVIDALHVARAIWLVWTFANTIVTALVIFPDFDQDCYDSAVYRCLLAQFIMPIPIIVAEFVAFTKTK